MVRRGSWSGRSTCSEWWSITPMQIFLSGLITLPKASRSMPWALTDSKVMTSASTLSSTSSAFL